MNPSSRGTASPDGAVDAASLAAPGECDCAFCTLPWQRASEARRIDAAKLVDSMDASAGLGLGSAAVEAAFPDSHLLLSHAPWNDAASDAPADLTLAAFTTLPASWCDDRSGLQVARIAATQLPWLCAVRGARRAVIDPHARHAFVLGPSHLMRLARLHEPAVRNRAPVHACRAGDVSAARELSSAMFAGEPDSPSQPVPQRPAVHRLRVVYPAATASSLSSPDTQAIGRLEVPQLGFVAASRAPRG